MNKIRIALVGLVATLMLVLSGVSAQAATDYLYCYQSGGEIYNLSQSDSAIKLYSNGPAANGCGYTSLSPGRASWSYPNSKDVDAFYVGANWKCTNISTNYRYYGNFNGTWYSLANDNVYIVLDCSRVEWS